MQTKQRGDLALSIAVGTVFWLAHERVATACGGTFCDGGLPVPAASMRVDQTGESILFAWGDGFVEAHVQIEYDGNDAQEFAWIVPVQHVPEIEVGSARLFQAVLDSTQPIYGIDASTSCGGTTGLTSIGFIQDPSDGGEPPDPPPQVIVQSVVGAFEYVVLEGGTADSVTQWLLDNGYSSTPEAPEILDAYIDQGFVFVAFKLRQISGVEDLHPVVLRYPGDEPCVPLRLTRVAAIEDMPIRVLALSDARAYPVSWRHVQLNRTRLDWVATGANYDELVIRALDEPGADGRGFVTEYAGSSTVVDRTVMSFPHVDPAKVEGIDVLDVYDELYRQGLVVCGRSACDWGHELVPSLLHEFIPVPEGLAEGEFYSCLSCYADMIDVAGWDAAAFADAFDQRIAAPLRHAAELLDTWPRLTRLFTRVSPHEMISDPTFARVDDAPEFAFESWAQTQGNCCTTVRVPGGRMIELDADGSWPEWSDEMPWAERIEEVLPPDGVIAEIENHSAMIDGLVAQRAAEIGCYADPGASDDGGFTSATPGDEVGSGDAYEESGTGTAGAADGSNGCGCATDGKPSFIGVLQLALGLTRRRSR